MKTAVSVFSDLYALQGYKGLTHTNKAEFFQQYPLAIVVPDFGNITENKVKPNPHSDILLMSGMFHLYKLIFCTILKSLSGC